MYTFQELLEKSTVGHDHLCPRQILGVRTGMYAAQLLELDLPQSDKRLVAITETHGCYVDGVVAATGCTVGHRTMFVKDFGKVAATFVDTVTEVAVRIAPKLDVRKKVEAYAPEVEDSWQAYVRAYQSMPFDDLLSAQYVQLSKPIQKIISRPGARAYCVHCGEEVFNEREVHLNQEILCCSCAGQGYYIAPSFRQNGHAAVAEMEQKL